MNNFKPKNLKTIIIEKPKESLDYKHEKFLDEFIKISDEIIPKLENDRKNLLLEYNNNKTFDEKLEIKYSIKTIDEAINSLKKKKKKYFLDNSLYIFNYFEEKKNISNTASNKMVLEKFFKISDCSDNCLTKNNLNIQKYFSNIDPTNIDINNFICEADVCRICNFGELIHIEHEGLLVCNNCSANLKYIIENDKPSYKEPPKEVCFYSYKRINHFREILAQFQAKETTLIPDDILENISQQIKKERLDIKTICNKKLKEVLKKLKYNKYYEHIPFIKDKLGVRPPIMTSELEETLCNLFTEIQVPYAKFCPEERVNFLNYYYTIYKLCELLNQKEFLPFFPMLKDREKIIEQDEIWKKICQELNWRFIPTI